MVKRSTWIWLILFLAVIGGFLYLKYRPTPSVEPTATSIAASYLFNEADGTLVRIRIFDEQYHIVELERPSGGLWNMVLPTPGPADQALAEAGATQVGALLIVNTVEGSLPLSSMSLDIPAYVIKLTFQDGTKHKLEVGAMTPTGSGYYVQMDEGTVYIVSPDGIDALLNLLSAPPYLPATSIPNPTIELAVTPTDVTPTP